MSFWMWFSISVWEWCVWIKIERWLNWTVLIFWPCLSYIQWCSVWSHCIAVVQEMFEHWGEGCVYWHSGYPEKKWHVMPKRLPTPGLDPFIASLRRQKAFILYMLHINHGYLWGGRTFPVVFEQGLVFGSRFGHRIALRSNANLEFWTTHGMCHPQWLAPAFWTWLKVEYTLPFVVAPPHRTEKKLECSSQQKSTSWALKVGASGCWLLGGDGP